MIATPPFRAGDRIRLTGLLLNCMAQILNRIQVGILYLTTHNCSEGEAH